MRECTGSLSGALWYPTFFLILPLGGSTVPKWPFPRVNQGVKGTCKLGRSEAMFNMSNDMESSTALIVI